MLFLVDGYNVTKSDPSTCELDLEGQRDALVARLRSRGSVLLGKGRIVVVFDAAGGHGLTYASASAPVEVAFSKKGSADDAIVARARGHKGPITLVSNDRELLGRVRAHASGTVIQLPASACYDAAGRGAARTRKRKAVSRDEGLPPGAHRITRELKDLWLGDEDE